VTNDTATSIKNHIYHYTTPLGMVICDSDSTTDDLTPHQQKQYQFLQDIFSYFLTILNTEVFHNSKTFFWSLEF
jgi:hypothetical protein